MKQKKAGSASGLFQTHPCPSCDLDCAFVNRGHTLKMILKLCPSISNQPSECQGSTFKEIPLPPIVSEYSYEQLVELALDPTTNEALSKKATNAIQKAIAKGLNLNAVKFVRPILPLRDLIMINAYCNNKPPHNE